MITDERLQELLEMCDREDDEDLYTDVDITVKELVNEIIKLRDKCKENNND